MATIVKKYFMTEKIESISVKILKSIATKKKFILVHTALQQDKALGRDEFIRKLEEKFGSVFRVKARGRSIKGK